MMRCELSLIRGSVWIEVVSTGYDGELRANRQRAAIS